jgi:hypothetical protein
MCGWRAGGDVPGRKPLWGVIRVAEDHYHRRLQRLPGRHGKGRFGEGSVADPPAVHRLFCHVYPTGNRSRHGEGANNLSLIVHQQDLAVLDGTDDLGVFATLRPKDRLPPSVVGAGHNG